MLALWLVMSGIYKPIVVALGVASCALTVVIVARLKLLDKPVYNDMRGFALINYVFWLLVEIGKADWAITKVILGNPDAVRHRFIEVPAKQRTDLGKMLFANSITITPGTVTVQTAGDRFYVHALTDEAAEPEGLADMGARVCRLERNDTAAGEDAKNGTRATA
ncbi:MAG: Na+/H+ antiporter subunit E [Pseudomonadota bacterium]